MDGNGKRHENVMIENITDINGDSARTRIANNGYIIVRYGTQNGTR